ncbi:hypothetical protein [Aquimarina sp. SS2-1]|uniref:hypothetical protein n=1 Tax=Aquimarina besae TaxID=3342247 RepID=UPI003672C5CC
MKTIHNINKWSFIITLLLYATVYFGLLAQILLGFIQVVLAIIVSLNWKNLNRKVKHLLFIYWGLIPTYGALWLTNAFNTNNDIILILLFCLIPMSIAAYFVYITYEIKKYQQMTKNKPIFS